MRIFKNAWFDRFSRKQGISDTALQEAIVRAERGLVDADLGGGVIKQRVARSGQGKSDGFRTIILFRTTLRAFLSMGSQRTIAATSMMANRLRSKKRHDMCSGYRRSNSPH